MRKVLTVLVGFSMVLGPALLPRPALAVDSCSVSGSFILSGFALGNAEVLGSLVFSPNMGCTGGTFSGNVTVKVDGGAPSSFPLSGTYVVNADTTVIITAPGVTLTGIVSELAGLAANAIQAVGDVGGAINIALTLTRSALATGLLGNTALGNLALRQNTTGNLNTATGVGALEANINGSENTATGFAALGANQNGNGNTAVGSSALFSNTAGGANTAVGDTALFANTGGAFNTAVGALALNQKTIGSGNTAVGGAALGAILTGSANIALGAGAGGNLSGSESSNIYIGHSGIAGESNTIRIGTQPALEPFQNRTFIAGIRSATVSGTAVLVNADGQLGTGAISSRRVKTDIQDLGHRSEALLRLRPVTFQYRPDVEPTGARQYGLIAEEVAGCSPTSWPMTSRASPKGSSTMSCPPCC
jgi:hypothetical protein